MKGKVKIIKKKIKKWDYERMLEVRAKKRLIKKYDYPTYFHDIKIIDDIIYNEKTHFVETFKEYLLYEDANEFLMKFYCAKEISKKLPKILTFYEKYSKIYANYTAIPESKYMYKNIKRKQKMIDQMQETEKNESNNSSSFHTLFTKNAMNSINSITKSIYNNNEKSEYLSTKSDLSLNKLIDKLYCEDERIKKGNILKVSKKLIKNQNENDYNNDNKKDKSSNNNSKKKMISALLSPKIKAKLIEDHLSNNLKNNILNEKTELKHKVPENIIQKKEKEKILLSANSNSIHKVFISKILSTPLKKQANLKKKIPFHSPKFLNNSGKLNIKNLVFSPKNFKNENFQKLFINNNIDNLKHILGNKFIINNLTQKKSKSNPQSDKQRINNINIINNIQNGNTQINIYTGNDLYKSLNVNQGISIYNSSSNLKSGKNSIEKNSNNNSYIDVKKKHIGSNFQINIRKIIKKNIIELESSSSGRYNEKKKFFEKLGKYFFNQNYDSKNNSLSNKISLNKSNFISKIVVKKKENSNKVPKKLKKELSCSSLKSNYKRQLNSKINNSNLNKMSKNYSNSKLQKLHDINSFEPKGIKEQLIYSERNKKSNKIVF